MGRLLHFLPDRRNVQVRTFSTTDGVFRAGPQEQFRMKIGG